jgi:hypothetical protein
MPCRIHGEGMSLLDCKAGRSIRDVSACEFECPTEVVTAAGVKLRSMVREGE